MRYYLDTEFDGAGGALISLALVREDGHSLSFAVRDFAHDPWVHENVIPHLWKANASTRHCTPEEGAAEVAHFLRTDPEPVIVADWLADISHLCQLLTVRSLYWTDPAGDLAGMPPLRFEVSNVDAYPTTLPDAVQHNAWWDAMALRHLLQSSEAQPECSERSDDPTLSGTDNKTSDGWMQEVVEVLEPFVEPLADLDDLPEHLRAEDDMPIGTALREAEQPTVGHLRAAASLLLRLRGASHG